MKLEEMVNQIKKHPRIGEAGMILCHNGIVRQTSRDGKNISRVTVQVNHPVLQRIIAESKLRPGIIEVLVEVNEGILEVGDDIMLIAVAGDIREHVFPVLQDLIAQIKQQATKKEEHA